ncbi:MAG: tol-pal system-associated acyl-CoA thioesterase [Casimicrobiaceae bacterium]
MSGARQPFSLALRVYYEDTDAAGVVYYANYLKFMERARTEWLSALGMEVAALAQEHHAAFVVHRLAIDYMRPARLGDRLDVGVALAEVGRSRLIVGQDVTHRGAVVTRATVTLACLDPHAWRPTRIPAALLDRLTRPS